MADSEEAQTKTLCRVLAGRLNDLPSLSSKIVRIFTSSTFTDTTLERNALMENVYPKIKEFCRDQHGLEFQVVDMRWGVRDEATDDHMTTILCMKEIDNCQRLSMGPNFVVFLGQKYGYRPIPTIIPAKEFELLRDVIRDVSSDVQLLNQWYKKDENSVPAEYILQPISSILTNFNNKRHQRLMEADQAAWWDIMGKLQKMLRKAAQVLFMGRKLDREQMHHYFMSVTEREVRRGIIDAKGNNTDHCLAFVRHIANVNMTALRFARNFVDVVGRDVDKEAEGFLNGLRDKLPSKLKETNVLRFTVEWTGKEGIELETHEEYLKTFCDRFYEQITNLVTRAVHANEKLSSDQVYTEILQHLHMCQSFCKLFQGREEVVGRIERYMVGPCNEPGILWGESGCGKTSLLAKAYSQVVHWLPAKSSPVMVLRFLGTSPDSSRIIPLLTSLCQQISLNYDQSYEDIPDELSPLVQHFKKLLELATEEKPLILFLDSLDQLSGADGAHQLAWLPVTLPPNVKLVVSTLPNYYNILDRLRKMVLIEENYVQVTPLGENLSSTILTSWLKNADRTVTSSQWDVVQQAISKCNLPLFVKLVFDEVCRWRSYDKPIHTNLAPTIHDIIMMLFDRIENQHGKILVSHAFGYLTAAKSGLSEAELEDLLSLDEKVLNDVYQYHLPPVRRIPPLLWTRIRNDLAHYFAEREADGINVINWYHRQFIEASRERYFRNVNFVEEIHSQIADYFLGIWGGGKPKPFEYSELQRQRFFLDSTKGESDRKVPEQPMFFTSADEKTIRYNRRKLSEVPFHLIRCHRYDDLYAEVLFNLKFLFAKLSCMPLQAVLADFEDALDHQYDRDVKLLADALRLSASVLSKHPGMVGPQVVGRLLPHYNSHEKIQLLIKQCDSDGLEINALVPSYHCLHTPGGPLQYSLEGHPFAPFGIGITSDTKYLVSVSNMFVIWDLSTGDVFRQVNPCIQGIMQNLCISPDDRHAVSYTNNNQVVICNIMAGDFKLLHKPTDTPDPVNGTAVNLHNLMLWSARDWYLYSLEGELIAKGKLDLPGTSLIHAELGQDDDAKERFIVWKTDKPIPGVETDDDMTLEVHSQTTSEFNFHSALALSKDKQALYACIAISDEAVACYTKDGDSWKYGRTLGSNFDKIFSLALSKDENYLVASWALGYKLWDLRNDKMLEMKLPTDTRNIPSKNTLTSLCVFTRNSEFLVAGVRKNLYVWDVKAGNLVKTLDAHFGRIIALSAVFETGTNKVVSSSIDKSIKVWNFDNILEDVHSIDRHERQIDALSLAANAYVGATTTRNCVGVWNLESGRLVKTLANSAHSSIVTHSAITPDAKYVISAESGNILFWDVENEKVLRMDPQRDVQQLILSDEGCRVIALSKAGINKCKCMCRTIPDGDTVYKFDFIMRNFKNAVVTCDGLFLVVPSMTEKNAEVLSMYHAKTGTRMYEMAPKYPNYKGFSRLVAMPNEPNQVALIDDEKGNLWDVKKKSFVRSVNRWNGVCTSNGKYGLYAPNRGGLELLELKSGKTKHTLIPRVAEGVFNVTTFFTRNDQHVIYYHSGHRSIRVFRVSDGKQIANYKAHAEVKAMASTQGGASVVLGVVDGSVVVLTIADPKVEANKEFLASLPSRQVGLLDSPKRSPSHRKHANGTASLGTVMQVARLAARAKMAQKSRACVVS